MLYSKTQNLSAEEHGVAGSLRKMQAFYAKQTDCSLVQTAVTDGSWAGKIRPHLANLLCSLLSKSLTFPCIIRNKLYGFQTRPPEHSV